MHAARARFAPLALVLVLVFGAGGRVQDACAEPPEDTARPSEEAVAPQDYMPRVLDLQERMQAYAEPPTDEGPARVLYLAWKSDLKPRSRALASKSKELTRETYWEMDDEQGAAVGIKPKQWGVAVRKLSSLYTEMGAAHKNYGKERISPDYAIRVWDKNHPAPVITGLTPAGGSLLALRRRIAWLRSQGLPVPVHLFREIDRYVILQTQEIEIRREDYRRWEEDRRDAHRDIRARYAEAKVHIEARREEIAAEMADLRALTADLQQEEEQRLRELVSTFPEDDPLQEVAQRNLVAMAKGRAEALRFRDARTSRYGTLLNQKWTVPRGYILREVLKAELRQKEAASKAAAPAPAGEDAK